MSLKGFKQEDRITYLKGHLSQGQVVEHSWKISYGYAVGHVKAQFQQPRQEQE